jgi:Pyridoxamine 5'-phosphate oxidase
VAKFYSALTQPLMQFVQAQSIFFVATAPCDGRVNLSPKGMDTFRCLSDCEVAYLDLTGSGNETSAHIEENGRLTLMFCSFAAEPLILRLYGQGKVVRPRLLEWSQYTRTLSKFRVRAKLLRCRSNRCRHPAGSRYR